MGDRLGTLDAVGFSFLSFLLISLHSFDHCGRSKGSIQCDMAVGIWKSQIHTFSTSHITTERGAWIWKLASKLNFLSVFVYYCTKVCRSDWKTLNLSLSNANGHITLNTPVLVRSLKLSNVESSQYLDGWPPGNTGCCWLLFFVLFTHFSPLFWSIFARLHLSQVPNRQERCPCLTIFF